MDSSMVLRELDDKEGEFWSSGSDIEVEDMSAIEGSDDSEWNYAGEEN